MEMVKFQVSGSVEVAQMLLLGVHPAPPSAGDLDAGSQLLPGGGGGEGFGEPRSLLLWGGGGALGLPGGGGGSAFGPRRRVPGWGGGGVRFSLTWRLRAGLSTWV